MHNVIVGEIVKSGSVDVHRAHDSLVASAWKSGERFHNLHGMVPYPVLRITTLSPGWAPAVSYAT